MQRLPDTTAPGWSEVHSLSPLWLVRVTFRGDDGQRASTVVVCSEVAPALELAVLAHRTGTGARVSARRLPATQVLAALAADTRISGSVTVCGAVA